MFFLLATALLIGLDLYISYKRMALYGVEVELNPVARQLSQEYGPKYGVIFLAWWNFTIIVAIILFNWTTLLHIFFGSKLALAALQLKSIQLYEQSNLSSYKR